MNALWEDLVNELVDKVQNVVPTLEHVTLQAKERLRKPPPGDLVYLTDRLIVSSAPAVAWPTPSYNDNGRDDWKLWREEETSSQSPLEEGESATPMTENPQEGVTITDMVQTSLDLQESVLCSSLPRETDGSECHSKNESDSCVVPISDSTDDKEDTSLTSIIVDEPYSPVSSSNMIVVLEEPTSTASNDMNLDREVPTNAMQAMSSESQQHDCPSSPSEAFVGTSGDCDSKHDRQTLQIHLNEDEHREDRTEILNVNTECAMNENNEISISLSNKSSESSESATTLPALTKTDGATLPSDDNNMAESTADVDENDALAENHKSPIIHQHPPASALRNSPANIVSFLEKRHGRNHFLAFSLMDERPDDRTLVLFRRQIVQLGWWSPCPERSETPSISQILKVCYAIHAYLHLDTSNVAVIYCANGKTRTAIAMACYLKFVGLVPHSREGFLQFLTKRGISDPKRTLEHLPPSLHLFFRQFDTALQLGGFLNRKPLLLRAIALQGIPVEDKPCLDIWDSSQKHVYTSHPEVMGNEHVPNLNRSQWADEEGFYRVNTVLEGDFLLLCRFGGDFAEDARIHDPSKILFRYTNTTGFLSGGYPYELAPDRVDLSRQYASHLDDEDFLVTLLFEANWERLDGGDDGECTLQKSVIEQLGTTSAAASERIYRCHEPETVEEGLLVIVQHHSARPNRSDIHDFQRLHSDKQLDSCEDHLICIALQLTNFELQRALTILLESPSFSWWKSRRLSSEGTAEEVPNFKWKRAKAIQIPSKQLDSTNAASKEILSLLDEVALEDSLDEPDRIQLTQSLEDGFSTISKSESLKIPLADAYMQNSGWMVSSMMYPRQGDIVGVFSDHYRQFHKVTRSVPPCPSSVAMTRPRLPFFPRNRPSLIPPPLAKRQRRDDITPMLEFLPRQSQREISMQLHQDINHTDVTLSDLIELIGVSQTWSNVPLVSDDEESVEDAMQDDEHEARRTCIREATGSMNREAKEQQEQKWEEAKKAEAREKDKQKAEAARKKEEEESAKQKEEALKTQSNDGDVPLKDDPEFAKYFKMLKMGMPKEQVLHAMTRDEKDQSVLDMDPNKSLKSQRIEEKGETPLNEDPEYEKYFKMLKMGLPMGAVKNALTRDGKDPSVMDLDPSKSLKSQTQGGVTSVVDNDGVALKDDPEYSKYFKMLKMGLPVGAVKNALTKDGKDAGIMDLDPEKSFKSQMSVASVDDGPALKDDPEYAKYFKMLTMGLPIGAVKNALTRDGKDPAIMDLDPNKSIKSQIGADGDTTDSGPLLKDDPEYAKYFKMLSMGLPMGAVKNALSRDGKDPSIMDLDPNKSVRSQLGEASEKDSGVPLKDDPEYSKYFKMLAMGLPPGAVKNALERDGKNPAVMDMDPTKSVAFQMKKGTGNKQPVKKKKRVRRKKIYWNPIDPSKLKEDSMWHIVRGAIAMDKLNYDEKEFDDLFTESADPADQKNQKKETKKEEKKLVQVIDPKRSMNGGIVLARLKTDHSKIAEFVDKMDHGKFDATQLKALKEYLPDADERRGLISYMKKGDSSPDVRDKLYADCSETEKYMVTMIGVQDAGPKLDVMLFRSVFKTRFEETTDAIRTLNAACDELRSSERLRKLMAIILTVVNQINTGGEGKMAMGFTLDALLKLNEAKAFDKKTSVLHYVVKLVKKNDDSLLGFDSDIKSVVPAENVLLDGLSNDVKSITEELDDIHETIKQEADRLEQAGELKPMSLAELAEQKTAVRVNGGVAQFNKMDHLTGRTSIERFSLNAKIACEQASESIENIKKKYRALLEYFGEDEQMATSDFFGTLRRFVVEWRKAVEQVEAIEKKEAKEKKKAAAKAAKAKKTAGNVENSGRSVALGDPVRLERTSDNPTKIPVKQNSSGGALAALAAAAAASRIQGETNKLQTEANSSEGIAPLVVSAAENQDKSVQNDSTSALLFGNHTHPEAPLKREKAITSGEEMKIIDGGSPIERPDLPSQNNFANKAVAYRRKKERKNEADDSRSDFLSSAMAYKKKKSQRDLNSGTVEYVAVDDNIPTMSDSMGEPFLISSFAHESAAITSVNLHQKTPDSDLVILPSENIGNQILSVDDLTEVVQSLGDEDNETEKGRSQQPPQQTLRVSDKDLVCTGEDFHALSTEVHVFTQMTNPTTRNEHFNVVGYGSSSCLSPSTDPTTTTNSPVTKTTVTYAGEASQGLLTDDVLILEQQGLPIGERLEKEFEASRHSVDETTKDLIPGCERTKLLDDISSQKSIEETKIEMETCFDDPLHQTTEQVVTRSLEDMLSEKMTGAEISLHRFDVQQVETNATLKPHVDGSSVKKSVRPQAENETLRHSCAQETEGPVQRNVNANPQGSPLFQSGNVFIDHHKNDEFQVPLMQNRDTIAHDSKSPSVSNIKTYPPMSGPEKDIGESYGTANARDFESSDLHSELPDDEAQTHHEPAGDLEPQSNESETGIFRSAKLQETDGDDGFHELINPTLNERQGMLFSCDSAPHRNHGEVSTLGSESCVSHMPGQGPMSFISVLNGQNLETFFKAEATQRLPQNVVSPYLDDSSVGIMAGNLQRRNLDSRLSESWVQGDTIQNFMGWADQAIRASDSESVRNFEFSRDLNDVNDFDDESTIATVQDDASVISWTTPSRTTGHGDFDQAFNAHPPFEVAEIHTVRPAQVAASILFNDSPVSSGYPAGAVSSLVPSTEEDILNMGLFVPPSNIGFDGTHLSYAIEDAGLDDGLGFGDNGLSYGNEEIFHDFATASMDPQSEPKSPERKSWFRWMG